MCYGGCDCARCNPPDTKPKQPVKQTRLEKCVYNAIGHMEDQDIYSPIIFDILRAEYRALRRAVKRVQDKNWKGHRILFPGVMQQLRNPDTRPELARKVYNIACDDILHLLKERGR